MANPRESFQNLRDWLHRIDEATNQARHTDPLAEAVNRAALSALAGHLSPDGFGLLVKITPPTTLPSISLGRDEASEILDSLAAVDEAMKALPFRDYLGPSKLLTSAIEAIEEAFPGGYVGPCDFCGGVVGATEIGAQDFENGGHACKPCAAEIEAGDVDVADRAKAEDEATRAAVEGDDPSERLVPRMVPVDWSDAKQASAALDLGQLPPGFRNEGETLVVPNDMAVQTRGHTSIMARFSEVRTESGQVLKSKSGDIDAVALRLTPDEELFLRQLAGCHPEPMIDPPAASREIGMKLIAAGLVRFHARSLAFGFSGAAAFTLGKQLLAKAEELQFLRQLLRADGGPVAAYHSATRKIASRLWVKKEVSEVGEIKGRPTYELTDAGKRRLDAEGRS